MTHRYSPWLLLHHLPSLGPAGLARLLEEFPSPEAIFQQQAASLRPLLNKPALQALQEYQRQGSHSTLVARVERSLEGLARCGAICLDRDDPRYPPLLLEIPDPPAVLFVQGNCEALNLPQLAVVGSRQGSMPACNTAFSFARELARCGFAITSGLARGIDGASHRGCLEGKGVTVAVLGSGIDEIYPRQHRDLARAIVEGGGALVSEFEPGTAPRPGCFPRRNRIISGLSMGVLVVEAATDSGSLITARLAMEQNREVFAMPGSIHNPLSRGCHQLIRQGAVLVETAGDIVSQLDSFLALKKEQLYAIAAEPQGDSNPLLTAMGFEVISIDDLVALTGRDAAELAGQMLVLELEGRVQQVPGGYQRRVAEVQ